MPQTEQDSAGGKTAASRYKQLVPVREPYLRRARDAAELTIPALLPPEGTNGNDLYQPFQSVGARGVNNLAAKLLLALFPPGSSFFRLIMPPKVMDDLMREVMEKLGMDEEQARKEIEKALSEMEQAVISRMEQRGIRTSLFEVLKHLLVPGNILIQTLKGGGIRLHFLDRYVVKRDKSDNVLEIITKETVSKEALPLKVQEWLELHSEVEEESEADTDQEDDKQLDLYTWVRRHPKGKSWLIHQEVSGVKIPGTEGKDPINKPRFIACRAIKVDGEDYGRGYVEEYLGDLASLEALSKAIVEFSAAAAKILIFVDDTGMVDKEELARSPSGAFVEGDRNSISVFQLEKFADFRVASEVAAKIETRLEQAFLLFSSIQRNAERVTAEEVRTVATELEQALGGLYSILAQELQRPLVDRIMFQMQRDGDLSQLPNDSIQPEIVAGLEGLSRSSDLSKYQTFIRLLQNTVGEEQLAMHINFSVYAQLVASSLGIDVDGLVRSDQQVQQMQARQQQIQTAQKLGPEVIKAASSMTQEATPTPS